MDQKQIRYLDSMGLGSSKSSLQHYPDIILRYLKDEWEDKKTCLVSEMMNWEEWYIDIDHEDTPQQENGYACGIFTFLNTNFLSMNKQLTFT